MEPGLHARIESQVTDGHLPKSTSRDRCEQFPQHSTRIRDPGDQSLDADLKREAVFLQGIQDFKEFLG
jgi:hypothetical protein